MNPAEPRSLGRTGVRLTQMGFGGASIGELFVRVPEEDALSCLRAAWDAGIRYFDTAPWYGRGLSELRTGAGLRDRPRAEYVLSTKVGRWLRAPADPARFSTAPWTGGVTFEVVFDYSYEGIMRAYEQSQLRLGLTRYDLAIIHDLDLLYHAPEQKLATYFEQLATSGFRALAELKTAGLIRGIGAGINALGLIPRFLELFDMDFFLVAMPYTLLHQEVLEVEFPRCVERGVGFVIGAVFSSGILATGAAPGAHYNYAPAPPDILERVRRIEAVCARHGVPLAAAALQFPLGHPSVASVIPGASRPDQVRRNVAGFRQPIPQALWAELKAEGLLRQDAPVPT
ncbi:MAG: pyridoxal 4-dehydrogenase [Chloroflexi bacterium 13_1_40CM_4_68_4]|nr:MAG: pyridoxal 4-dehydrogenase [Chloroflexi bacterium 13_1_40CM_4_68_4]